MSGSVTLRPSPLQQVQLAVKANLLPGMVLWAALGLFLLAYALSPVVQDSMAAWVSIKAHGGLAFAFGSFVTFAVLLPEALDQLVLRKKGTGLAELLYAVVVFGSLGVTVDLFYGLQAVWFGEGSDWATILKKTVVDQFVFAPVTQFIVLALFQWRDNRFEARTWAHVWTAEFWVQQFLPVQIALWCVWIPSIMAVYFMPTTLQFPVMSVILTFWMLIFRFIRRP